MQKISALITCKNEAHNMDALLKSVSWCDEIIVVDSFSTDETLSIAKKYTSEIFQHEYDSPAKQKNRFIPKASHDWVLILDADERVKPELESEIKILLNQSQIPYDAFWIYRENYFLGKKIRYSGWQKDKVIRLFKRDLYQYDDKQVHEEIMQHGNIGKLKHKLIHYTYKDLAHYLEKMDRYANWAADDLLKKNINPGFFHFYIKPPFRFFKQYFLNLGILDGLPGFIICKLAAWGVFLRYVKLKEMLRKNN